MGEELGADWGPREAGQHYPAGPHAPIGTMEWALGGKKDVQ